MVHVVWQVTIRFFVVFANCQCQLSVYIYIHIFFFPEQLHQLFCEWCLYETQKEEEEEELVCAVSWFSYLSLLSTCEPQGGSCVQCVSRLCYLPTYPNKTCPQGAPLWPDCQTASPSCGSPKAQPAGTLTARRRE